MSQPPEKKRDALPHLTVAAVIRNLQGQYLMVQEKDNGGNLVINQPAGHVENHETLLEAIHREVLEETGWRVQVTGIVGLYSYTPTPESDTYHRTCFICSPVQQQTKELDPDIEQAIWIDRETIEKENLRSPLVLRSLIDFEKGKCFPLSILCDDHIHGN